LSAPSQKISQGNSSKNIGGFPLLYWPKKTKKDLTVFSLSDIVGAEEKRRRKPALPDRRIKRKKDGKS
jgi:hypothetical protein